MFRNLTIHTPLSNEQSSAKTLSHDKRDLTIKPFITIFSSRAHVAISLKKWQNVRDPTPVSGFSCLLEFGYSERSMEAKYYYIE